MEIIVVTGQIGAGKSVLCDILRKRGIPVYDCDSAAKSLYGTHPELASLLCDDIFSKPQRLKALEDALFPVLLEDFRQWAERSSSRFVAMESATILQKEFFNGFGDYVLWVQARADVRMERALKRGGISPESILSRMALQGDFSTSERVDCVIDNSSDVQHLENQVNEFLKSINYGKRTN